ncbi:hypothetical protein CY35_03G079500 [Sphagnum magellanicum]|nr:hypothetical protein CY35_03G079500 [Sphagnum magellanicum]
MGRTGGKRDGYSSCMLRFTALYTILAALLMVRSTVYAQCDQQSLQLGASAPFSTSGFTCQGASGFPQQAWSRRNGTDTLELVFIAPVTQGNWVGLGFSSTGKMAGSVALIALMNASSTSPTPYWWRLDDHSIPPSSDAQYSSFSSNLNQSQYIDGTVYISVVVNITAILAPSTPDSFLFAYGLASGSTPQQHTQETSQVANFAPAGTHLSTSDTKRGAHGLLNLLGWGVFLPIGAIIARYCKVWDPTWFYLHISFQVLGFILIIAGLVTGLTLQDSYKGVSGLDSHRALAIIVFILATLQMLAIVLRPKKDAKLRRYWNWYHHWVGRFALVLAAVNLFVGIHLAKENGWNVGYGIILGLEIASILALETISCIRGRNKEHSSPTMSPNLAPNYDNDV